MKPSTWDLIVGHESYRCWKSGILRWSNGLVVVKKRLTPKIADLQEVPNGHKAQQSMLCCSYFSSGPQRAPKMHVRYLGLSTNIRYQDFVIIYYGSRTRDMQKKTGWPVWPCLFDMCGMSIWLWPALCSHLEILSKCWLSAGRGRMDNVHLAMANTLSTLRNIVRVLTECGPWPNGQCSFGHGQHSVDT